MECIVTAGPTYEPIDGARRLTNFSTGQLGCELAEFLTRRHHRVHLLLGEQAVWSQIPVNATVRRFSTGADLAHKLSSLAAARPGIQGVFHAAAVSDFSVGEVFLKLEDGTLQPLRAGKLPTSLGPLLAELRPTPKIISRLRAWFPEAYIVGWKYEVDPDRARVLALASEQIAANQTDACVANGPGYGTGFGLVTCAPDSPALHLNTREELFEALLRALPSKQ